MQARHIGLEGRIDLWYRQCTFANYYGIWLASRRAVKLTVNGGSNIFHNLHSRWRYEKILLQMIYVDSTNSHSLTASLACVYKRVNDGKVEITTKKRNHKTWLAISHWYIHVGTLYRHLKWLLCGCFFLLKRSERQIWKSEQIWNPHFYIIVY